MKKIRLYISKIRNHYFAKIPDVIASKNKLSGGECIEVTIHSKAQDDQVELWDTHPEDINEITYEIYGDVHTMNMYNRIYIPEKFRFFFPLFNKDFIIMSNSGNIKTHLSNNGYLAKGMRYWFSLNGPLIPKDKMMNLVDDIIDMKVKAITFSGGGEPLSYKYMLDFKSETG